jgi:hypothetical protein
LFFTGKFVESGLLFYAWVLIHSGLRSLRSGT